MSQVEARQLNRDSLFLMANIKVEGDPSGLEYRVKVRNLSSGGMMAEGVFEAARGAALKVELRNIGWVRGSVAWRQGNRFGIAFDDEIDPRNARGHAISGGRDSDTPRFVRPPLKQSAPEPSKIRKI
ncbi:MAG TPA: PilZ domain-containing protein [Sphingomonadaceae bacterium]|nr:PilZ domain-containing protein [Sphingomonadaceae bacterium]